MDVTCERCSTAYEFDDALVSERGTTVKCTSCGHQFKVRRPQPSVSGGGQAPERWLVRTIDGRELEFRALRELQSAIAQASITRDDVLSRGGSRPRRLGSIAELEPFFVSAGAGSPKTTSLGLGPRATRDAAPARVRPPSISGRQEVSVAIPLPRGPDAFLGAGFGVSGDQPAPTKLSGGATPVASTPSPGGRRATIDGLGEAYHPGVVVNPLGAPPVPSLVGADNFDDEPTRAEARDTSNPPGVGEAQFSSGEPPKTPPQAFSPGETAPKAPPQALPVLAPSPRGEEWPTEMALPPPAPPVKKSVPPPPRPISRSSPVIAPRAVSEAPKPAARPSEIVDVKPRPKVDAAHQGEDWPLDQHTASVPPLTPTPAALRPSTYDEDFSEPRFSNAAQQRSGAPRWIAAVTLLGMVGLAAATVGRKYLVTTSGPTPSAAPDGRLATLLSDGEKSLTDGDLESAKEQFDKASMIGERDLRAASDLARLAVTKADVDWLHQRLLAPGDPDLASVKRELDDAAARAKKAADRASQLGPNDLGVLRSRVDALRISNEVPEARKLASAIAAQSSQPDNALVLAELDLCEDKPDWPIVLGRLRSALTTDGNLGRARALLVYALARSGDGAGARSELDRLVALSRPHPLLGSLRTFVGKSSGADASLPDGKHDAGVAAGKPFPTSTDTASPKAPRERGGSSEKPAPERYIPAEPRSPGTITPDPGVPLPPPPTTVDTSDLPGVKPPPGPAPTGRPATPPPTAPPSPPTIDTSDLPGLK